MIMIVMTIDLIMMGRYMIKSVFGVKAVRRLGHGGLIPYDCFIKMKLL